MRKAGSSRVGDNGETGVSALHPRVSLPDPLWVLLDTQDLEVCPNTLNGRPEVWGKGELSAVSQPRESPGSLFYCRRTSPQIPLAHQATQGIPGQGEGKYGWGIC